MKEVKFISHDCANDNIALARRTFKLKFIKTCGVIGLVEAALLFSLINMEKSVKNIVIMGGLMVLGLGVIGLVLSTQKKSEEYFKKYDKREYISFTFNDTKITGESKFSDSEDIVSKDYDYRLVRSFKEDGERIYLKVSDTASLVFNKTNSSEEDVKILKEILRSKGIRVD